MAAMFSKELYQRADELDELRRAIYIKNGTHYTTGEPINEVNDLLFMAQGKIRNAASLMEDEEEDPTPLAIRIVDCVTRTTNLTDDQIRTLLCLSKDDYRKILSGEVGLEITKIHVLNAFIKLGADLRNMKNDELSAILPIARVVENSKCMAELSQDIWSE